MKKDQILITDLLLDNSFKKMQEGIVYIEEASLLNYNFVSIYTEDITALEDIAEYSYDQGITLLIETKNMYKDSKALKDLIEKVLHLPILVLWNVNETIKLESLEETINNIGEYIAYTIIDKDFNSTDKVKSMLKDINYEGEIKYEG